MKILSKQLVSMQGGELGDLKASSEPGEPGEHVQSKAEQYLVVLLFLGC